jgi:large exoprotein involved in heme utilization and adhesion
VVTGRGGIPDNPSQYLRGRAVWRDTRNLSAANRPTQPTTNSQPPITSTKPGEGEAQAIASKVSDTQVNDPVLIEAQGWMVNENGTVILTAESDRGRQANSWIFSKSCEDISQ